VNIKNHYRQHRRKYNFGAIVLLCVVAPSILVLYGLQAAGHSNNAMNASSTKKAPTSEPITPPPAVPMPSVPLPPPDTTPDTSPLAQVAKAAPIIAKIQTQKRVVFLSVDDGAVKNPKAIDFIEQHHYPLTLFLSHVPAGDNYAYFKPLVTNASNTVQDHTINHPNLTRLSQFQQQREICSQADNIQREFGAAPTLFRPPYGLYNAATQRAAAACGLKAIVLWSATINDGKIQYQTGNHLVPGDIVLMHFRPKIIEDLQAFANEIESQHLTIGKLEDWLR
jgi:peptidoglycan/xylan/chitin deacetylase (PgdA/CDA1 family)